MGGVAHTATPHALILWVVIAQTLIPTYQLSLLQQPITPKSLSPKTLNSTFLEQIGYATQGIQETSKPTSATKYSVLLTHMNITERVYVTLVIRKTIQTINVNRAHQTRLDLSEVVPVTRDIQRTIKQDYATN